MANGIDFSQAFQQFGRGGQQGGSGGGDPLDYLWAGPFAGSWIGSGVTLSYGANREEDIARKEQEEKQPEVVDPGWRQGIYSVLASMENPISGFSRGMGQLGKAAEWVGEKLPGLQGFTNELGDFFNYGSMSFQRGAAESIGGALEYAARLVSDKDYRGTSLPTYRAGRYNRPELVSQRGIGAGSMIGDAVDDIAIALAGGSAFSGALAGRGGAWAASSVPKALQWLGRFAPQATKAQRWGAAAGSALQSVYSGLPQLGSDQIGLGQLMAQASVDSMFDRYTAGTFKGGRLANMIGDAVTGAVAGATSGLVPLGMQDNYTVQDYLAQTAISGGLGTALGIATNFPGGPGRNRRAVSAANIPDAQAAAQPTPTKEPAAAYYAARMANAGQPEAPGFISDAYLRSDGVEMTPDIREAAAYERKSYAYMLASQYDPNTLAKLLDLEVGDLEVLTPESVAAKIENEWLNQAANGKGIDALEQRLAQAGLQPLSQTDAFAYARRTEAQPTIAAEPPENPQAIAKPSGYAIPEPTAAQLRGEAEAAQAEMDMARAMEAQAEAEAESAIAGMPPEAEPIAPQPSPQSEYMYKRGKYTRKGKYLPSEGEKVGDYVQVDVQDVKTTTPPSVKEYLALGGSNVESDFAKLLFGTQGRLKPGDAPLRAVDDIVLYQDPKDDNLYAIDGRKYLRAGYEGSARPYGDVTRDPETGALTITPKTIGPTSGQMELGVGGGEKIIDGSNLRARVFTGPPEMAVMERMARNPELSSSSLEKSPTRQAKAEVESDVDQKALLFAESQGPAVAERAKAEDIAPDPREAKKAVNWYKAMSERAKRRQSGDVNEASKAARESSIRTSYASLKEQVLLQANEAVNSGTKFTVLDVPPASQLSIVDEANLIVQKSSLPDGHPLGELSPILDAKGNQMTYDELLQGMHQMYGKMRSKYDPASTEGILDAWDQYSRLFSPKAWPALATEVKAYPLAALENSIIERVPGIAGPAMATPPGVRVTLPEQVEISTIRPDTETAVNTVDASTILGRQVVKTAQVLADLRTSLDEPMTGVKDKQKRKVKDQIRQFIDGEPSIVNIDAPRKSRVFSAAVQIAGMSSSELIAKVKSGQTDFGVIKVVGVEEVKGNKIVSFVLDKDNIKSVVNVQDVASQVVVGKLYDDHHETAIAQRFEDMIDATAETIKVDVKERSLLEETGATSVKELANARAKTNHRLNADFRRSYDQLVDALVNEAGLRRASAQAYAIRMAAASSGDADFGQVDAMTKRIVSPEEEAAVTEWSKVPVEEGKMYKVRRQLNDFMTLSGQIGDMGLRSVSGASRMLQNLDDAVIILSETTGVNVDVVRALLDDDVNPISGVDEAAKADAIKTIMSDRVTKELLDAAQIEFEKLKGYSMVTDITKRRSESTEVKTPVARNITGPLASVITGTTWMLVDNGIVQDLEDDELYMGIPGSTWKQYGGGGGYAAAAFGLTFVGRNTLKPSNKTLMGKLIQKTKDLASTDYLDTSKMTPQQKSERYRAIAERRLAKRGVNTAENPELLERETLEVATIHEDAGKTVPLPKLTSWLSLGTLGMQYFSEVSPLFKRVISDKRDEVTLAIKQLNPIIEPIRDKTVELSKKMGNAKLADIANEVDFRMTQIRNMEAQYNSGVTMTGTIDFDTMRALAIREIREKYFSLPAKPGSDVRIVNEDLYREYLDWQSTLNPLREEHAKYHVAKSVKARNPMDLDGFRVELDNDRKLVATQMGALQNELDVAEANFGIAKVAYNKARAELQARLKLDDAALDAYINFGGDLSEELVDAMDAKASAEANVAQIKKTMDRSQSLLDDYNQRIQQIDDLPRLIEVSKRDGYLPRPRRGKSRVVVRVEAEDVGINVRLEMDSDADANIQKSDLLKEVAIRRAAEMYDETSMAYIRGELPGLTPELKKSIDDAAQEEAIARGIDIAKDQATFRNIKLNKAREIISVMSEGDIIREFGEEGKVYYDVYSPNKNRPVRSSKKAKEIILKAIHIMESGSHASSVLKSGYQTRSNITVDDLVQALDESTEFTIDHKEVKKALIDKGVMQKIEGSSESNIDLAEVGRLARRLMQPPNPNLTRRRNVEGYYDPFGQWTGNDKIKYLGQQVETMIYDITDGTSRTVMSGATEEFMRIVDDYELSSPNVDWVRNYNSRLLGEEFKDHTQETLRRAERVLRQYFTAASLTLNVKAAIQNRLLGAHAVASLSAQGHMAVYGAKKINSKGEVVETKYFNNKYEADSFLEKQGAIGSGVKILDEGGQQVFNGWLPTTNYEMTTGAAGAWAKGWLTAVAPRTMWRMLASSNPLWSAIYDEVKRLNLQDATFTSSVSEARLNQGFVGRNARKFAYILTERTERGNNLIAMYAFADLAMNKMGVSPADFKALNPVEQQQIITAIREQVNNGRRLAAEEAALDKNNPMPEDVRRYALAKILGEAEAGRRLTQGGYAKIDMTRFESFLSSAPGGHIASIFVAPYLRALDASMAMTVGKLQNAPNWRSKLKVMAPVVASSALMAALVGVKGTPFFADMYLLVELGNWIERALSDDEERKKLSTKQYTEDIVGRMFESRGLEYDLGVSMVRNFVTEGLVRQIADVPIGTDGSVTGGFMLPGPAFIESLMQNSVTFIADVNKRGLNAESLYRSRRMFLGTAGAQALEAGSQLLAGQKLDNFGRPVIDPITGMPIGFRYDDVPRALIFGRRHSDVRTTAAKYEVFGRGSIPLYSDYDKINYVRNVLESTKYVSFGATEAQYKSMPKGLKKTVEDMALLGIYPDAPKIHREINKSMSQRSDMIKEAKKTLDEYFIKSKNPINLGGGNTALPEELINQVDKNGLYDPSGRNSGDVRRDMYGYIDDYYLAEATAEVLTRDYGVDFRITDPDLAKLQNPVKFAMAKFIRRYYNASSMYYGAPTE